MGSEIVCVLQLFGLFFFHVLGPFTSLQDDTNYPKAPKHSLPQKSDILKKEVS